MNLKADGSYTFEWKYVDGTVGDSGSGRAE
jgi:hypothetical protein